MTFQLKILGNNSAIPAHNRNQTAQLIIIHNQHILIDCGEGTQLQFSKFNIKPGKIKHILISHLHGDHYFGLIGLLSTLHLYGRRADLNIFAPPLLEDIIRRQLNASQTTLNYELKFIPLQHEDLVLLIDHPKFTVHAFPLNHGIACYGFLFKEKAKPFRIRKDQLPENILIQQILQLKNGEDVHDKNGKIIFPFQEYTLPPRKSRSYAYCSDTQYDEQIISYIKNVDLLYHESTFGDDMEDRAALTFHSTARQAATIALLANTEKLLLGHYSTRYKDPTPLLYEARKIFPNTFLSIEGETIYLEE